MSEQAGKYLIKVQTSYDGAGAVAAGADLKKIESAAKESGEKINFAGREFRQLLNEAGAGQAAMLLRAAVNPLFLSFAGGIEIVEQLSKRYEMMHEQNLKNIQDADRFEEAERNLADTIANQMSDALSKAAIHAKHLDDSVDPLTRSLKIADDDAKNSAAGIQRLGDATLAAATARVKLIEALGLTAPAVADTAIAKLQIEADLRKQALQNQQDDAEIQRKRGAAADYQTEERSKRAKADAMDKPGGPLAVINSALDNAKAISKERTEQHKKDLAEAEAAEADASDVHDAMAKGKFDMIGYAALHPHVAALLHKGGVAGVVGYAKEARSRADASDPRNIDRDVARLTREQNAALADQAALNSQADQAHKAALQQKNEADDLERAERSRKAADALANREKFKQLAYDRQQREATGEFPVDPRTGQYTGLAQADMLAIALQEQTALHQAGAQNDAQIAAIISQLNQVLTSGLIKSQQDIAGLRAELEDTKSQLNARP